MKNKGWLVTCVGMGINLALGVLYAWSVIKKAIPVEWGWSDSVTKRCPIPLPVLTWFVIGFGIFAGADIGLGYASATPPAVKWAGFILIPFYLNMT